MATPRKTCVVFLAFLSWSARAVRPESRANVSIEVATQVEPPCPEGQELWLMSDPRKMICGPKRSLLGSDDLPKVRATDRWCCGASEKLIEGKKCQKACFSRAGKEDCVPFCEDPRYRIVGPVEKYCPLGQEVYRFMFKRGKAASEEEEEEEEEEEHRYCLPERKVRIDWEAGVSRMRELEVVRNGTGCCSGEPEGKVCLRACVDNKCIKVCESPDYSEVKPLRGCPPNDKCFKTNCKTDLKHKFPGMYPWHPQVVYSGTCHERAGLHGKGIFTFSPFLPEWCYTVCPPPKEARYECRPSDYLVWKEVIEVHDTHCRNVG